MREGRRKMTVKMMILDTSRVEERGSESERETPW